MSNVLSQEVVRDNCHFGTDYRPVLPGGKETASNFCLYYRSIQEVKAVVLDPTSVVLGTAEDCGDQSNLGLYGRKNSNNPLVRAVPKALLGNRAQELEEIMSKKTNPELFQLL